MLASNITAYMKLVARDALGYEPDSQITDTELLMHAGVHTPKLARRMRVFGYTVTSHGAGTIGISGKPTNVEEIRALEVRIAREHVARLETAGDDVILQRTARL
jgi:hypothetical protein